jgi:transcriptional regulator with XRE-family HTH domain
MKRPWDDLRDTHERLRWARMRWQESRGIKPSASAAAESLGVKIGTYSAYERSPDSSKHIPLDHQKAIQFARKFGVSWEWLLTGDGRPEDIKLTPSEREVIDALREAPEARQAAAADAIIKLLKAS